MRLVVFLHVCETWIRKEELNPCRYQRLSHVSVHLKQRSYRTRQWWCQVKRSNALPSASQCVGEKKEGQAEEEAGEQQSIVDWSVSKRNRELDEMTRVVWKPSMVSRMVFINPQSGDSGLEQYRERRSLVA